MRIIRKFINWISKPFRFVFKHFVSILLVVAVIIIATNYNNDEIVGVTFGFVMMGTAAYLIVDRFIQKRKVKQLNEASLQAEIDSLKTQINPHFFFNTLNNLYGLAVEKSDLAPEMILKLSEMMRYTIYEGKKDRVAIKEEVAYLENYIELHKIRYHKDVDIKFNYMLEDNGMIPPLLLIILLENAFKHGVETLTENAYIRMKLMVTKEQIYFEIENNFEPDAEKESGIGLQNLKRRLQLLFPKKHNLTTGIIDKNIYKAILKLNHS